jgi:Tfp pilus assembly protein PilP
MKVGTGLLMLVVAAGAVGAQTAPATAPVKKTSAAQAQTSAKPATAANSSSAKTSGKPATATSSAAAKTSAKPATTATSAATKTAAKPVKKTVKKPAAAAPPAANVATNDAPAAKHIASSKRDPFVSPVQSRDNGPINCGTGKRCLVLDQTVLQGIVKAPNGMIAVVSNSANKAYFLRENDPVYNGFVMRITPDSVVFREQVTDRLGNKSTREVVKKVNAPVV